MNKTEVLYFHAKLQHAAREQGTNWELHGNVFHVCVGLQNKKRMLLKYLLSLTASKITEKVELAKYATGQTSAILCRRYDNCLHAAILYSPTIKSSTKTFRVLKIQTKTYYFYKM